MKKHCILGLLCILFVSGCGGSGRTVSAEGSTAMVRVVSALQEAYREAHPEVRVNISGTGSGAGIEAALSGVCEIGLSSRALTEEESARGAEARTVALDGIAVIVHPSNPVAALDMEELAEIFTGGVTNWAELSGGDRPIAVYGREAGSGTRTSFEALAGVQDRCVHTSEYCSAGDVAGNVAENPNGIGYVSMAVLSGAVRAVVLDGTACTAETVRNGTYPLRQPMLLVTKGPLSGTARDFLNFVLSPEADGAILLAGAVPPEREGPA